MKAEGCPQPIVDFIRVVEAQLLSVGGVDCVLVGPLWSGTMVIGFLSTVVDQIHTPRDRP